MPYFPVSRFLLAFSAASITCRRLKAIDDADRAAAAAAAGPPDDAAG